MFVLKKLYLFVEILSLFMYCSPDLSGYLYDCYFEILIRLNNVSPSISLS